MIVNVEDPIVCIVYSCVRSNHVEQMLFTFVYF